MLLKHSEPCVPPVSALPCCGTLPLFKVVELVVLIFRLWLVEFKVVLVLRVVMLLIGMMHCFATVLIVNVRGILLLLLPVSFVIPSHIGVMYVLYLPVSSLMPGWGVLLVDVSNAFSSLNCIAVLLHAHVL